MKILDVRWFSSNGCVGVVKVHDPYDGIRYYIGVAPGLDVIEDSKYIASWGSFFPKEAGDKLFKF